MKYFVPETPIRQVHRLTPSARITRVRHKLMNAVVDYLQNSNAPSHVWYTLRLAISLDATFSHIPKSEFHDILVQLEKTVEKLGIE